MSYVCTTLDFDVSANPRGLPSLLHPTSPCRSNDARPCRRTRCAGRPQPPTHSCLSALPPRGALTRLGLRRAARSTDPSDTDDMTDIAGRDRRAPTYLPIAPVCRLRYSLASTHFSYSHICLTI